MRRSGVAGGAADPKRGLGFAGGVTDPRRGLGPIGGAVAGLMIAILDLEIIGRRYPAIRDLPRIPQYLDHMLFGALVVRGRGGSAASASNPTVPSTSGRRPR
ncbi:hypothetical protein SAMN05661093_00513 [Kibdelosporangium aridum]|uniref:Uncharacterized protein n=1 Tax=Kibdelosporangium aridum TaxID=2030 RepID=A0A1Y5WX95_KIBAR|nr:hypothetical protein SAMN05661093_00513 [Kibdelosporangium aridum]